MRIRYFAAASSATGLEEETFELPEGTTLGGLEALLAQRHPTAPDGGMPLERVLTRCSFLRNGVATTDRSRVLEADDSIDVLPPFAGG